MEIYSEMEKYEMDAKLEQLVPSEDVDPKEVTDTIAALVNQAKIISEEKDPIIKPYEDVDNPTTYIGKTEEKRGHARENYNHLQEMKKSYFWTIGRNKAKVEKTQEVLFDIIDAVDNNANATKALFNNQIKLAEFSKKLYGIGLMGIASNRIVVRAIKLRLEHASKEEINDLARRELESLVYELEKQQQLEKKIDDINNEIGKKIGELTKLQEAFISKSEEHFSNAISEIEKKFEALSQSLNDDQSSAISNLKNSFDDNIAHINEKSDELTKSQEAFMSKSKEHFSNALSQIRGEANAKVAMMKEETVKFIDNHEALYTDMKKQVKLYKIISIIAIIGSIASLVYTIL